MKKVNKISDTILQNIVNQIVRISDPDKIILFGSHATGKANKDSDYDVCVLKKHGQRKILTRNIYMDLSVGAPVDVLVTTPSRFEKIKEKSYYVYYEIAKDGIIIYER